MNNFLIICLFGLSLQFQQGVTTRGSYYAGYKVYSVIPRSINQVEVLAKLSTVEGVSFWDGPSPLNQVSTLSLSPAKQKVILNNFRLAGLEVKEVISNLQELVDREIVAEEGAESFRLDEFHTLNDIYRFLNKLAVENPNIVTLWAIEQSFENRPIYAVKISRENVNGTREGKKAIFLDSNIHAREWLTSAVMTYFLNELVVNPNYASWTEDFDFYLIVVANPDGLEYTHTGGGDARNWRKTRSVYGTNHTCVGTDPNRNFDFEWSLEGASDDPCHNNYAGPHALSEKESQAVAKLVTEIHEDMVFFGSVHTCGQIIMLPYGLTNHALPPAEKAEYLRIAERMTAAIYRKFEKVYSYGTILDVFVPPIASAGSSMDWVKGTFDTYLSLSFELRDTTPDPNVSMCSFIINATEIVPTALEFMDGFQVIIEELRAKFVPKETEEECPVPDCRSTENPDAGTTEKPEVTTSKTSTLFSTTFLAVIGVVISTIYFNAF